MIERESLMTLSDGMRSEVPMSFTLFPGTRLALALDSLAGLSVGDALGAQYFVPGNRPADLLEARLPAAPWDWTDDTEQACCLVATLAEETTPWCSALLALRLLALTRGSEADELEAEVAARLAA